MLVATVRSRNLDNMGIGSDPAECMFFREGTGYSIVLGDLGPALYRNLLKTFWMQLDINKTSRFGKK